MSTMRPASEVRGLVCRTKKIRGGDFGVVAFQGGQVVSEAWSDFQVACAEVTSRVDDAQVDPLTQVEGYKWLASIIAYSLDIFVWSDPRRPRFVPQANPVRKRNGDNPDAEFQGVVIDPRYTYRVTVSMTDSIYTAITVYGGSLVGDKTTKIIGHVNNDDAGIRGAGTYEVILSKKPHDGLWVELEDDCWHLVLRDYFVNRDSGERARVHVEVIDDSAERSVLTGASLAERVANAARYIRSQHLPVALNAKNEVGAPYRVQKDALSTAAADAVYAQGSFSLSSNQKLILTGRSPECLFWNVCLWNQYLQTFDYSYERTSLNFTEVVLEPDGTWEIVICDRDPGHPNWVSTAGHSEGIIWFRWFLAESVPDPVGVRVVDL